MGVVCDRALALAGDSQNDGSRHNHGNAQQLTHRDRAEDEADLRVRLAKKLDHNPAKTVANQECAEDCPRWREPPGDEPEQGKE